MPAQTLPHLAPHHRATIDRLVAAVAAEPTVLALILGGSLAHGYARPESDVDVVFVVSAEEHARRRAAGRLHYHNRELCAYDGYIDGKYVTLDFLHLVSRRGSDPARYAFKDARVLWARVAGLEPLLAEIARYPVGEKPARIRRFGAQLLAWRWYYGEAVKARNPYLTGLALQKITLFSGRLVLVVNERLFPYHKWLLREVAAAPRQPVAWAARIEDLWREHSWPVVDALCREVLAFAGVELAAAEADWPTRFMEDTELAWMQQEAPIDEI